MRCVKPSKATLSPSRTTSSTAADRGRNLAIRDLWAPADTIVLLGPAGNENQAPISSTRLCAAIAPKMAAPGDDPRDPKAFSTAAAWRCAGQHELSADVRCRG